MWRKTIDIPAEEVFRRMDAAMFPGDHELWNNVDSPPEASK